MKNFIVLTLTLFSLLYGKSEDYTKTTNDIKSALSGVISEYRQGNIQKAKSDTQNAYFGLFEDIEGAIRINISAKKAYSMEKQFGEIRKAIKAGESVEQVEARVQALNEELNKVLPIILNGHKLVGEASDVQTLDLNSSKLSPTWKFVFENISADLHEALEHYEQGKKEEAKKYIQKAKFTDYRNSKLEIAIRQHTKNGQNIDSDIQRKMGEAILGINNAISQDDFKAKLDEIKNLIYKAAVELPADSSKIADVKLPNSVAEEENKVDFTSVVNNINKKMSLVLNTYQLGKLDEAMSNAQDIYFDEFEASGMENKVGAINVNLKSSIESSFGQIVALMKAKKSKDEVEAAMKKLSSQLDSALDKLNSEKSVWSLFIWALTIILREGFEALIIVTAVVAYLLRSGNSQRMGKVVYSSVIAAVVASFVVAFIMNLIFQEAAGQKRELLEGITMLVAVALLFYVGFWLLSNASSKKWNNYIKNHVSESLSNNSAIALWWTVFLAVFREGAETVLFYQALIFDANGTIGYSMIAGGFAVGVVALIIIYYLFKIFAIKIPIREFFLFTSAIIFYMSFVFVGKGVLELVEGKVFIPTTISWLHFPEWANSWLGLWPYYESLIPQLLMLSALIVGVIIMKKKQLQN